MLGHAWLVTALNPKSITFFVAFLPAFLDPHADFLSQMLVFETTFLVLAFANAFRLCAGGEQRRAASSPTTRHRPDQQDRRHPESAPAWRPVTLSGARS
jgi:threonine/homoserine/homoserine lactone efflux protein